MQSYKDASDNVDEDEDEDVDEFNSSIQDSNINQIAFEANEFDQMYESIDDSMATDDNTPSQASIEKVGSAQWRIQPNNMNRPIGAAPLVPSHAPQSQLQSRPSNGYQRGQKQQDRNSRGRPNNDNNNNNNGRIPIKNRLGNYRNIQRGQMEQRVRNAFNAFNSQQQTFMNMQNHFQNVSQQIQQRTLSNFANQNSNENNQVNRFIVNQARSDPNADSLTSLINSAHLINSNTAVCRLGPQPYNCSNQLQRSSVNQKPYEGNRNLQLQPAVSGPIVVSDSLRLADLMNMDKSSFHNLDVTEVAKNAMLLLSTVFHKPILNEELQQELSHLQVRFCFTNQFYFACDINYTPTKQQNNGLPEEPSGLNVNIQPEATDLRMYHRFK